LTGEPDTREDRAGRTVWDMRVWLIIVTPLERNMRADAQTDVHDREQPAAIPKCSRKGDWSESDLISCCMRISVISK